MKNEFCNLFFLLLFMFSYKTFTIDKANYIKMSYKNNDLKYTTYKTLPSKNM